MKVTKIAPGHYKAKHVKRTFDIRKHDSGWAVTETGIHYLTITNGWTDVADGISTKSQAISVARMYAES